MADYSAKPKNFARSTFSELWNFFTIGASSAEPSGSNRSGFISSGGDSYSAVLFISSLEDRGVRCSSTDLLVKLMKDVTFDECFDCLLPGKEVWIDIRVIIPERANRCYRGLPSSHLRYNSLQIISWWKVWRIFLRNQVFLDLNLIPVQLLLPKSGHVLP